MCGCKPRALRVRRESRALPTQLPFDGNFAVRVINTGAVPLYIDSVDGITLQPGDMYALTAFAPGQSLIGTLNLASTAAGARATIELIKEV